MKYMGSKNRIAKHILPIMLSRAEEVGITTWVEPFVGGANMIDKVPSNFKRVGYDINPHTIFALKDIRDNPNELPDTLSEDEYKNLLGKEPESIKSWLRFNASFGGKFDGGYARENPKSKSAINRGCVRNYTAESKRNALKQSTKLQGVDFVCSGYEDLSFTGSVIYCDPPYQDTTGYANASGFNYEHFFDWCREQAKDNIVFVSEYSAPEDFIEVWRGELKTNFASTRKTATHIATEKLFEVKL